MQSVASSTRSLTSLFLLPRTVLKLGLLPYCTSELFLISEVSIFISYRTTVANARCAAYVRVLGNYLPDIELFLIFELTRVY